MNLAVLSGKGGTGKTTVAANLAVELGASYVDCDVEEPNGFVYLRPQDLKATDLEVDMPQVDRQKCTLCGKCAEACRFNALAVTKSRVELFQQLCHSCGVCQLACPHDAVGYVKRKIGVVEQGAYTGGIALRGILNVGEPIAVPVIDALLERLPRGVNLLDCAPGTSCNVVATLAKADKALLVVEPTVFGLHDFELALKLVKMLELPFGVVVNKHSDTRQDLNLPAVLGRIPRSRRAAEICSRGELLVQEPDYRRAYSDLAKAVREVWL